jgi:hypothetical protein
MYAEGQDRGQSTCIYTLSSRPVHAPQLTPLTIDPRLVRTLMSLSAGPPVSALAWTRKGHGKFSIDGGSWV